MDPPPARGGARSDRSTIWRDVAGMDIGRDNGGVVELAYEDRAPDAFSSALEQGACRRRAG